MAQTQKMKIKKGDTVIVITGRDKGARGEVTSVIPSENRLVVAGINTVKRHTKPSANNPQGGVVEKELSIHASNVALIDPKTDKATRVGYKINKDGTKIRVARKSGQTIE